MLILFLFQLAVTGYKVIILKQTMSQVPVHPPSYDDAVQNKDQVNTTNVPLNNPSNPSNPNTGGFDNIVYKPRE